MLAIQTGGGDDWVTLAGGAVVGAIDGGGGTNTLTFDVGAGNSFFFNSGILNFQSVRVLSGDVRLGRFGQRQPRSLCGRRIVRHRGRAGQPDQ